MKSVALTPEFAVAPQLTPDDLAEAAAAGIRSVINNRPDGEAPDQPPAAEMEAAARALGLDYRYVPIVPGRLGPDEVEAFGAALDDLPGPVLAFCRSGTRSATVWAMAKAGELGAAEVVARAAEAGYDLQPLRPILEALARRG
jgi:sulfide:quinone oxidoreductase